MLPAHDNSAPATRHAVVPERRALAIREHLIVATLGLVATGPALQALAYGRVSVGLSLPAGAACFYLARLVRRPEQTS